MTKNTASGWETEVAQGQNTCFIIPRLRVQVQPPLLAPGRKKCQWKCGILNFESLICGCCIINIFMVIICFILFSARVFVGDSHFHPCLIFTVLIQSYSYPQQSSTLWITNNQWNLNQLPSRLCGQHAQWFHPQACRPNHSGETWLSK